MTSLTEKGATSRPQARLHQGPDQAGPPGRSGQPHTAGQPTRPSLRRCRRVVDLARRPRLLDTRT